MIDLEMTVLASEGPMVRAYLWALKNAGYRPNRIVLMLADHDPATGKPIGKRMPKSMRPAAAEAAQDRAMLHWPRQILKKHADLVAAISTATTELGGPSDFGELYGRFEWDDYAPTVERVLVSGLQDPLVSEVVAASPDRTILYTGGGIVGSGLLAVDGKRILHVHPGYLPDVRGADGLLWSYLHRGRPGVSVFHMAAGIDTGDLVTARDYSPWNVKLTSRPDDATLYRSIFSFIDPVMRGALLVETLANASDPNDLDSTP